MMLRKCCLIAFFVGSVLLSGAGRLQASILVLGGAGGSNSVQVSGYLANPDQYFADNSLTDLGYYNAVGGPLSVFLPATLNGDPINVFCVDLLNPIGSKLGTAYGVTSVRADGTVDSLNNTVLGNADFQIPNPYGNTIGLVGGYAGATPNAAGAISWLVNHEITGAFTLDQRMGLQAAIWKAEYGNNFDITNATTTLATANAYQQDLLDVGFTHSGADPYSGYTPGALLTDPLAAARWISPGLQIYDGIGVDNLENPLQGLVAPTVTQTPAPGAMTMLLSIALPVGLLFSRKLTKLADR